VELAGSVIEACPSLTTNPEIGAVDSDHETRILLASSATALTLPGAAGSGPACPVTTTTRLAALHALAALAFVVAAIASTDHVPVFVNGTGMRATPEASAASVEVDTSCDDAPTCR
jgi:hypothetical protein